jgi:hypothetical protein
VEGDVPGRPILKAWSDPIPHEAQGSALGVPTQRVLPLWQRKHELFNRGGELPPAGIVQRPFGIERAAVANLKAPNPVVVRQAEPSQARRVHQIDEPILVAPLIVGQSRIGEPKTEHAVSKNSPVVEDDDLLTGLRVEAFHRIAIQTRDVRH